MPYSTELTGTIQVFRDRVGRYRAECYVEDCRDPFHWSRDMRNVVAWADFHAVAMHNLHPQKVVEGDSSVAGLRAGRARHGLPTYISVG